MRSTIRLGLAGLAAALFVTTAQAQGEPPAPTPEDPATGFLKRHDKDGDGRLGKDEWPASPESFDKLDRNGDGRLDASEMSDPAPGARDGRRRPGADRPKNAPKRPSFDELDANKDGKVTRDEWPGRDQAFERVDKDKDGAVTREELAAVGARGQGEGDRSDAIQKRLARLDQDGDGKVSKDEWPGRPEGFDRLDQNKDGFIEPDEVQGGDRARQAVRERLLAMDKDGDGAISREEFEGRDALFQRLDRNGDGRIAGDELEAKGARGPQQRPNRQRPGAAPKRPAPGTPPATPDGSGTQF